ncbi:hypothetical protein GCM10025865_20410 [Paraoerskovia sediminicola]|uniref:Glycosyl transferases group 1 n=2 Tax=Paraoerskovia sediminicola TaxID=1138587 RepID=A0ABN6XCR7_9CELL|nr:hypothetical protein GCM10025865_20410 [Paraoerskovia sediminicola]
MAVALARSHPDVTFTLVGPDEGEGAAVDALLREAGEPRIRWIGPARPEETSTHIARASISVLPSVDEPFPMSVLESMAHGRPVVVTDTCGLAPLVERAGAGIVVGEDDQSLTAAVRRLLDDPALATDTGRRGRALVSDELSMGAVADRLETIYRSTTGASKRSR